MKAIDMRRSKKQAKFIWKIVLTLVYSQSFGVPINFVKKISLFKLENLSNFDTIFVSKYVGNECFLLSLYLRSLYFPAFRTIYPLNWAYFPLKGTYQEELLCDLYKNNATSEKEPLNDVIRETNMASKFNKFFQLQLAIFS